MYEEGDVTVLRNQTVHTDRDFTSNRPDIIIKNKKEKTYTLIDVVIPAERNVGAKGRRKEVKIQEFRYRDTTNVELEMCDYTSSNWSHWISKEKLREKFGSYTSYIWNITHNTENTTV